MDVYFELRLILESNPVSKRNFYEGSEIMRPQSKILSKCQNKKGELVKFFNKDSSSIHIIVVDNSSGISGMFDKIDCSLAAYGDQYVNEFCKRDVFGFFQPESVNMSPEQKEFNGTYANLRSIIHGVLFIKKLPEGDPLDFHYAYYFTPNYNVIDKNKAQKLAKRLSKILPIWN